MKRYLILIIIFFYASLYADSTDVDWESSYEYGYSVQQTTDGGYIITGYAHSYEANSNVFLIKTDGNGDTLWTNTYGGSNNDKGYSVQQTSDGGYIITGFTFSYGAGYVDLYLIKTDSNGDTAWTRVYGESYGDYGYSVQQTTDGGYIIAGQTFSYGKDLWLIKTYSNGDTAWTKTYGGSSYDYGKSVQQTTDGGYIITGFTFSYGAGSADIWLIKTDTNGDTTWTQTYGGSSDERGKSVQQTTDGGYIITGFTESYGAGGYDVWLIKTYSNGDTAWTKTYGGSSADYGESVQQTTDGGYIITGRTYSYGAGSNDVWLIKTDSNGDTAWTKTFGGIYYDYGYSVQQTTDSGYIVAGFTNSCGADYVDVWLIKTDSNGDTAWTKIYGRSSID